MWYAKPSTQACMSTLLNLIIISTNNYTEIFADAIPGIMRVVYKCTD